MTHIFVLRKKGSETKNRMKEEEIEKGNCGPPTRKVFFLSSEPRTSLYSCTRSQTGQLTAGHLSPSPIGNLDLVDNRGSAGEGASSAILF